VPRYTYPSFIKIISGILKLREGNSQTHRQHDDPISPLLFLQTKEGRLTNAHYGQFRIWKHIDCTKSQAENICSYLIVTGENMKVYMRIIIE
jgi:hypothetical protein